METILHCLSLSLIRSITSALAASMVFCRFAGDSWTMLDFGQLAMKWPDMPHADTFTASTVMAGTVFSASGRAWLASSAQ